jgi:signal transduction histidine kinase
LLLLSFLFTQYATDFIFENYYEPEFYGMFAIDIFIAFLVYLIVKYKAFNIRVVGAQALIFGQFIIIASMLTFASSTINRTLIGITLFITLVMGWNLVRSVKKEIALKEELEVSNDELSERKDQLQLMADKLAQSNDQLRVLDNAKSEFISIASHQLRTPLTAIKGFISLLLEGSYGDVQEKHKEVLNKIYISNERLITLVEDLLNISRIESGRMDFKFDKWDLEKICKEVLDTFMLRAKDHHLYLEYKAPETPLPEVMIDGVKVREVVSNLVDNAIKYTLDGHGGITLRLQQFEDKVRVIISDTGIGIPATELPYLFAKFSRGKDISRLNTGGTGLGLYVGKNMIESNGGRIWAESEGQDRGSRFIIEIPLVQSEELMKRWG